MGSQFPGHFPPAGPGAEQAGRAWRTKLLNVECPAPLGMAGGWEDRGWDGSSDLQRNGVAGHSSVLALPEETPGPSSVPPLMGMILSKFLCSGLFPSAPRYQSPHLQNKYIIRWLEVCPARSDTHTHATQQILVLRMTIYDLAPQDSIDSLLLNPRGILVPN